MAKVIYHLLVLGAGGTGTYFLKEVSRYLASLPAEILKCLDKDMYIMDGDIVEKKNIDRQAYFSEDIGFKKASKMAEILNESFFYGDRISLQWHSMPQYLLAKEQLSFLKSTSKEEEGTLSDSTNFTVHMPLIISCVDNHAARLVTEDYFNSSYCCILFDSANEWENGECVFSYKVLGTIVAPLRSFYFPDIKSGDLRPVTEMSCTEMNAAAPQHIFTNMFASLQLLSQFSSLIETGSFKGGYSVFNQKLLTNDFFEWNN